MSTIKTTHLQHPSSGSPNLTLAADGSVSGGAGLGGLVHIHTESFSAVSSVSIDDVFTSDYQNYRVLIANENSASGDRYLRLRVSGTDITSSIYNRQNISGSGASANAARQGDANTWNMGNQTANQGQSVTATFFRPAEARWTAGEYSMTRDPATPIFYVGYLSHRASTAYDGLTFYTATGTMTGTIRIYGYANS